MACLELDALGSESYPCNPPRQNLLRENDQMTERRARSNTELIHSDDGVQLARVRRVCSTIPDTMEKISHGEPTFFTPKRVFAMFANNHHGDGHVGLWLPAASGVQAALIEEAPDTYFRPPYVGVAGWVGVELSRVNDEQLGALIREAYRLVTSKTVAAGKKASARSPRASRAAQRERSR
jgi:hypothetical protein